MTEDEPLTELDFDAPTEPDLSWCPSCEGTGNSTPDPYGVCPTCAGLGRVPMVRVNIR